MGWARGESEDGGPIDGERDRRRDAPQRGAKSGKPILGHHVVVLAVAVALILLLVDPLHDVIRVDPLHDVT